MKSGGCGSLTILRSRITTHILCTVPRQIHLAFPAQKGYNTPVNKSIREDAEKRGTEAMFDMKVKKRSEIEAKYKWRLDHIFATEAEWEAAFEQVREQARELAALNGHVAEDPRKAIRAYFSLMDRMMPVAGYAMLARECDNGDTKAQAMSDRVGSLQVELFTATAFLEPELLAMDTAALQRLIDDPDMADYDTYLKGLLREKPHTLDKEQERLLAMLGEVTEGPGRTFDMLTSVDMKLPDITMPDGTKQPMTEGSYSTFIRSTDREVRRQAFTGLMNTYGSFGSTIASVYGTSVKKDVALARAHHYADARSASLEPLEIPEAVYDNLIATVHEYLPVLQEYLALRKQLMGLEELHMYDLYVPMVGGEQMKLPYEKAYDLVLEGLAPMGDDYVAKLKEARDDGWIDVFPSENKSSGAFSAGHLADVHPYVLLNHNDNLSSAFTIAHELGHSMHSYFSNITQPGPKRHYSLFVAEVASICNEFVMMRHLQRKFTDRNTLLQLLNHQLEQFRTTCFRQTMFAEFELAAHRMAEEGKPLTKDTLSEVYYALNQAYYGDTCAVDAEVSTEWMRIPHFYTAYYVFVYATGLCAAVSLSERILREGESAVRDYRKFLSAGCSVPPIEALKLAGIDMSRPEPIRAALEVFRGTIARMRDILKED